jgi:long-chain acyl-CoA synthetase
MLLKAYYKRPDATAESINAEGYFMTGDAGFFDEDGHLKIIDRAKDVGKLTERRHVCPNYIENKLKFFQHIKEVVCFGNGAISSPPLSISTWKPSATGPSARAWPTGYTDLACQPQVYELIRSASRR